MYMNRYLRIVGEYKPVGTKMWGLDALAVARGQVFW